MMTCRSDYLRQRAQRPQRPSRARTGQARVVGPLVTSLAFQVAAVATGVVFGFPLLTVGLIMVGIAVVTVVISRRTIGSLLAGAGIRVAQPYEPGEQVRVFVPALNSVEDAEIVRVGAANTTLLTARGVVLVPNVQMLRGTSAS